MAIVEKQTLEEIIEVIVAVADPEQIILFGSQSRGDARSTSDIDLLIVEGKEFGRARSRREQMALLWRRLADIPIAMDVLFYSRDEVDYWRDSLNSVVARALREGKVVYDRLQARGSHAQRGAKGSQGLEGNERL